MSRHADFFQETISATTEILGGTAGAWGAKMLALYNGGAGRKYADL
jgi:hypothetical protein